MGKDSAFRLGEMDIDDSKIMRFKSRTNVGDDDDLPDARKHSSVASFYV